jgi:predicted ATPase/class 3 adenylate cyclase
MLPAQELPTGTVTFFFSDIQQSTRLASRLGEAYVDVLARHREIIRAAFQGWNGQEVSTGGDSFFAVFPAPTDAIGAAALIQRLLEAEGTGTDTVRVRIGLHTGSAVRVGHDYVGLDVHLAARIADAGHGGQVLISEATRAALGGEPPAGLQLVDLGRHRLKDVGPQRLWQLQGTELPAGPFPPLRSLEAHPTNLPVAASPMVDRERELAELKDLAPRVSVLTITGPGGIGKTRLALELARGLVPRFPDGVFHLELAAIPEAPAAAAALLDLLQLPPSADDGPVATLLAGLRSRDLLLVLETADRVAGLPELVAAIAAACPRIRVLITSRSPLHVQAEREYSVAPLPRQPAVELFLARATAAGARLPSDAATSEAIGRLVTRLDGIPLAIELAAARTRVFSPLVLLDRLERDLPALGAGAVDAPDRQRTLQGTIAWSCDLLPPDEQTLFRELAVFPESFDLAAIEAIATQPSTADIVAVLEALVDRSLVLPDASASGEPRFRLLGPIREFALEGLRATGLEDAVRARFAEHWATFARGLQDAVSEGTESAALQSMATEEANLRAALRWATSASPGAADHERSSIVLSLGGSLGRYWWIRGRVQEGLDWLERALRGAADMPTDADTARVLYWKGVLLDDARRPDEARAALEAALALYREMHDDAGIARAVNSLGVVARSTGDVESAERLFNESVERKRALGDRAGMAVSLSNFGVLATDLGRFDQAVEYMRQALAIDEEYATGAVPVAIANLGNALIRARRIDEGVAELRRALPGLEELGDPELVADALVGTAVAAFESTEDSAPARAARLLGASVALRTKAGLPLRAMERDELDALEARIRTRLDDPAMVAAQAEVAAVDVESALAMLREELLGQR